MRPISRNLLLCWSCGISAFQTVLAVCVRFRTENLGATLGTKRLSGRCCARRLVAVPIPAAGNRGNTPLPRPIGGGSLQHFVAGDPRLALAPRGRRGRCARGGASPFSAGAEGGTDDDDRGVVLAERREHAGRGGGNPGNDQCDFRSDRQVVCDDWSRLAYFGSVGRIEPDKIIGSAGGTSCRCGGARGVATVVH